VVSFPHAVLQNDKEDLLDLAALEVTHVDVYAICIPPLAKVLLQP